MCEAPTWVWGEVFFSNIKKCPQYRMSVPFFFSLSMFAFLLPMYWSYEYDAWINFFLPMKWQQLLPKLFYCITLFFPTIMPVFQIPIYAIINGNYLVVSYVLFIDYWSWRQLFKFLSVLWKVHALKIELDSCFSKVEIFSIQIADWQVSNQIPELLTRIASIHLEVWS